jgi:hypothetical protein
MNDNAYRLSQTAAESDALALYADWYAIGDDMREAMKEYGSRGTTVKQAK